MKRSAWLYTILMAIVLFFGSSLVFNCGGSDGSSKTDTKDENATPSDASTASDQEVKKGDPSMSQTIDPNSCVSKPGQPVWFELGTTDPAKAKAFYSQVFGWTFKDDPMPDGSAHITILLQDKALAGMYQMMKDQLDLNIPPNWMIYFLTEDVKKTVETAKSLGAKVYAETMDVMDYGVMAVLGDPAGAAFALWQPKTHKGMEASPSSMNAMSWVELETSDLSVVEDFYSKLFSWKYDHMDMGESGQVYTTAKFDDMPFAGLYKTMRPIDATFMPNWLTYITVEDCAKSEALCKSAGGTIALATQEIPQIGKFAVIQDPLGAFFAIIQYNPHTPPDKK